MSYKANPFQKTHCERHKKQVKISSKLDARPCSNAVSKNRSTGTLNNKTNIVKPKKTTKSDCIVGDRDKQGVTPAKLNNGQACGDAIQNTIQKKKSNVFISMNNTRNSGGVQQYFRNKNFRQSSASLYGIENLKKGSNLNTINEQSEDNLHERAVSETIFYGNSSDAQDVDGKTALEDIEELKKFRRDNYFECHAAAAKQKGSVTSLKDHRCIYRLYLNDRLFPVPVRADYTNVIRCTECHLPLVGPNKNDNISGTIQAKVKVNGQLRDVTLILPVKNSLIIKERRKEVDRKEEDPLYFGIVKLSRDGDSVFHRNLPSDSLALRYQKGYQVYVNNNKYEYERVRNDDVIVI